MEDVATPSINAELMARFVGQKVRLVCELDDCGDGSLIQARTSDKGLVTIQKEPRTPIPTSKYVEFIGIVVDEKTMREESHASYGDSFGESPKVCLAIPRLRENAAFDTMTPHARRPQHAQRVCRPHERQVLVDVQPGLRR
jgi:hypothetical protein